MLRAIDLADRGFKVEIYLVRGHLGVPDNELAKFQAMKELALWNPPEASG